LIFLNTCAHAAMMESSLGGTGKVDDLMQKLSFVIALVLTLFVGCGGGDEAVDSGSPVAAPAAAPAAAEEAPASEPAAPAVTPAPAVESTPVAPAAPPAAESH